MKEKSSLKDVVAKWVIRLSGGKSEIRVKKGDEVKVGQSVAEVRDADIVVVNTLNIFKGWDNDKQEQWRQAMIGKEVKTDDVLVSAGGWGGSKVTAGVDGVIVGVDEFGGVHINCGEKEPRPIKSPVKAKVNKIEDDKITLSFKAVELSSSETGKGKVWGDCKLRVFKEASVMKAALAKEIIFIDYADQIKITKAEAIGVAGVIVVTDKPIDWAEYYFDIPVVSITESRYEELSDRVGKSDFRVMINSNSGRILVVVQ